MNPARLANPCAEAFCSGKDALADRRPDGKT